MARGALHVRAELAANARIFGQNAPEYSSGRKGAIIGRLNEALGSDENRRIVLSWLFRGVPLSSFSTKELSRGAWFALDGWIGSWHDDSGWHVRPDFMVEAMFVVRQAVRDYAAMMFRVDPNGVVASAASLPG